MHVRVCAFGYPYIFVYPYTGDEPSSFVRGDVCSITTDVGLPFNGTVETVSTKSLIVFKEYFSPLSKMDAAKCGKRHVSLFGLWPAIIHDTKARANTFHFSSQSLRIHCPCPFIQCDGRQTNSCGCRGSIGSCGCCGAPVTG